MKSFTGNGEVLRMPKNSITINDSLINGSQAVPIASAEPASVQQCLIRFTKDAPEGTIAEFKLGVRSLPYLADHGFQDVIVLPGSLYVEMALCVHVELLKHLTGTLRKATFQNPVILSDDDCTIRVIVREQADRTVEY